MIFLLTRESAEYDGQDVEDLIISWSNNLESILDQLEYREYYTHQIIFLPENGGKTESIEYLCISKYMDENFLRYPPFSFTEEMVEKMHPILNKWCDKLRKYLLEEETKRIMDLEQCERKEYERLKKKFG